MSTGDAVLAVASVAMLLGIPGCGGPDEDAGHERRIPLLADESMETESTRQLLIERQRELFSLLLEGEREKFLDYVTPTFRWGTPAGTSVDAKTGERRSHEEMPGSQGYWAFVAGFTPPDLTELPGEYIFQKFGQGSAQVLAGSLPSGDWISTGWQRTEDGWRATVMAPVRAAFVPRRSVVSS